MIRDLVQGLSSAFENVARGFDPTERREAEHIIAETIKAHSHIFYGNKSEFDCDLLFSPIRPINST